MDELLFTTVLDLIYGAATSPDKWEIALARLGSAFHCNVATMIHRNLRTLQGSTVASGIDQAGQSEYLSVWTKHNVFVESTYNATPGTIVTDRQILPRKQLLGSKIYNGFLAPRDIHSILRISLRVEGDVHHSISLMRPKRCDEFEQIDIERARLFLPHLQRAAAISSQFNLSSAALRMFSNVLEDQPQGIVLIDRLSKVLFVNRAARAMARTAGGFILRNNRIEPVNGNSDIELRKLIAGATGQIGDVDAARGGVMQFARPEERPYTVVVAPLETSETSGSGFNPVASITITNPSATPMHPRSMLRKLFGLTAAEAQLAERMLIGDTPEKAAISTNTKISTVRTQLAQIFRKTDTNRQTELLRLLLRLPWSDGSKP